MRLLLLFICACATKEAPDTTAAAPAVTAAQQAEFTGPPPAPSRDSELRLYLHPGSHHSTAAEVVCPSDYRVRVPLLGDWAAFEGLPANEDCAVFFKGGAPAKYEPVRGGEDLKCKIAATTGVCVLSE